MQVDVIGHPFATTGVGQHLRSSIKALLSAGVVVNVVDVYKWASRSDPYHRSLILSREVECPTSSLRLFHINGDEVEPVLAVLTDRGFSLSSGTNVILPAWELPTYPRIWVPSLALFDVIWGISDFTSRSLSGAGLKASTVGQAAEPDLTAHLSRRYFGLRESAFACLTMLDLTSYSERKNPAGVLECIREVYRLSPGSDIQVIIKVKGDDETRLDAFANRLRQIAPETVVISKDMTQYEVQSLIACVDCYLSLHRAEGFGRVLAEAMFLNTVAVGTGWSGNVDFMNDTNSRLVPYSLIPVGGDDYPHGQGQVWADPDLRSAAHLILSLLRNPLKRREIVRNAAQTIRLTCSNRAVGFRMADALRGLQ